MWGQALAWSLSWTAVPVTRLKPGPTTKYRPPSRTELRMKRRRTVTALLVAGFALVVTGPLSTPRAQETPKSALLVGVGIHVEPVGLVNGRIMTGRNSY